MAIFETSKSEDDSSFVFFYYFETKEEADRKGNDDQEHRAKLQKSFQAAVIDSVASVLIISGIIHYTVYAMLWETLVFIIVFKSFVSGKLIS